MRLILRGAKKRYLKKYFFKINKTTVKFYLFNIILLFSTTVFSQNYTTKKTAQGKAKKSYDEGMKFNFGNQNEKALKEFTDALKADPTFIDAQIQQGAMFYELNKLTEAETAFEKALNIDPNYESKVLYVLGNTELKLEKYKEAAEHFTAYTQAKKNVPDLVVKAERLAKNAIFIGRALKNPVPFQPQSLGDKVNTPQYSEYLPVLTADEETLIYTARVNRQEDFYISKKANGEWQKGEPMTTLNTNENEGAQCISVDGKLLIYTVCNRPGLMGGCDIFYSQYKNGAWTTPKGFTPLNSTSWDSQPSISADGKTIYFSSDRAGGIGGRDIWYCNYENGKWGSPQNMGKPINTPLDEQTPYIHPDGVSLYFTSEGHAGMGGKDIYMARLKDSTWAEPQNLGYPINTKEDEGTLSVAIDGKTAYYARNLNTTNQGLANYDLFSFELPEAVRAFPVTYVKAYVKDAETKLPLSSKLEFVDLATQKIIIVTNTDENGEFLVCLPYGKNYSLNVSKVKYIFQSENFNLTEKNTSDKPFKLEIFLNPIKEVVPTLSTNTTTPIEVKPKEEKPIILKNVFFDTDKAILRSESFAELNKLKLLLTENPAMRIELRGHTDNQGSDSHNLDLSDRRAKAVRDYLIKNGIVADRLQAKGFGETKPIDSNDTSEGRQNNRRTEFVILK
jgi:outer membrane protein OmpA-like peptidoglycan-associated protein